MIIANRLLSLILLMSWLDCGWTATPDTAGTVSPVRNTAAVSWRDPELTARIATVQAGHAHYAKGNPGLETNFNESYWQRVEERVRLAGEEFLRPMVETFRALPFWRMTPNQTVAVVSEPTLVQAALATAERDCVLISCCTRETGRAVPGTNMTLRLPDGAYRLLALKPADGATVESRTHGSKGLGQAATFALPPFTDDLAVHLERTQSANRTTVPGTH